MVIPGRDLAILQITYYHPGICCSEDIVMVKLVPSYIYMIPHSWLVSRLIVTRPLAVQMGKQTQRLRMEFDQQNLHSASVFSLQVQSGQGWSCWPGGESQHVSVSKQFSDKPKAKGSKRTSLFPSISSHAACCLPLNPCCLLPLLHTHPRLPTLLQLPLQVLGGRGAEELFVCAVRASSQEISCDGNSGETSCWLGHCRGLITRTT